MNESNDEIKDIATFVHNLGKLMDGLEKDHGFAPHERCPWPHHNTLSLRYYEVLLDNIKRRENGSK